mmetsp:Transcript_48411/g.151801  ORF Transcript_48411/g.151801 Transcript_48411/m.151801 type:complete len:111 (-) Transcript_48411:386-718(-)
MLGCPSIAESREHNELLHDIQATQQSTMIFYMAYNQSFIEDVFSLTAKKQCSSPSRCVSLPSRLPHSLRCAMKFFNFCSLGLRETPSLAAVFTVCSHAAAASRPQSSVNQ